MSGWDAQREQYARAGRALFGWMTVDYPRTSHLIREERELVNELESLRRGAAQVYNAARGSYADASRLRTIGDINGAVRILRAAVGALREASRRILERERQLVARAQAAGFALDWATGRYGRALERVVNEAGEAAENLGNAAGGVGKWLIGAAVAAGLVFGLAKKGRK